MKKENKKNYKYYSFELINKLKTQELELIYNKVLNCNHIEMDALGKSHYQIFFEFKHPYNENDIFVLKKILRKSASNELNIALNIAIRIINNRTDLINRYLKKHNLNNQAVVLDKAIFLTGKEANLLYNWKQEIKKRLGKPSF